MRSPPLPVSISWLQIQRRFEYAPVLLKLLTRHKTHAADRYSLAVLLHHSPLERNNAVWRYFAARRRLKTAFIVTAPPKYQRFWRFSIPAAQLVHHTRPFPAVNIELSSERCSHFSSLIRCRPLTLECLTIFTRVETFYYPRSPTESCNLRSELTIGYYIYSTKILQLN